MERDGVADPEADMEQLHDDAHTLYLGVRGFVIRRLEADDLTASEANSLLDLFIKANEFARAAAARILKAANATE